MVAINKILTSSLLTSAVALADQAPENNDSHKKSVARAHLDKDLVKGIIEFTSKDGVVNVHLDVTGLPPNAGPFQYHIYDSQVSSKYNCEDAGSLFNPYNSNYNICDDLQNDGECAIGDLSGKHGYINTTCFETQYSDPYLSLNPNNAAFVGGMSLIITDQNNKRISCGNIKMKRYAKLTRDEMLIQQSIPENVVKNVSNSTSQNIMEENDETTYDSGSNILYASSVMGIILGGLTALL